MEEEKKRRKMEDWNNGHPSFHPSNIFLSDYLIVELSNYHIVESSPCRIVTFFHHKSYFKN